MTVNQSKIIDIIWFIKGYDGYGFSKDKLLYNIKTGRVVKRCLKGYTVGYNLNGRFISRNKLKPLLTKVIKTNCPF